MIIEENHCQRKLKDRTYFASLVKCDHCLQTRTIPKLLAIKKDLHYCPQCTPIFRKGKLNKKSFVDYIKLAKDYGIKFLDTETPGNALKTCNWECFCGNIWITTFVHINMALKRFKQSGKQSSCLQCSIKNRSGENHPMWVEDRQSVIGINKTHQISMNLIRRCLEYKTTISEDALGYTIQELKNHIESTWESWMNWENYGVHKAAGPITWQIDHIKPISEYLVEGITDLKIINALSNLRALESRSNLQKASEAKKYVEIKREEAKKNGIVLPEIPLNIRHNNMFRKRKIIQIDPFSNNVIKIWKSITDAQNTLHLSRKTLNKALTRGSLAGGFKWDYFKSSTAI